MLAGAAARSDRHSSKAAPFLADLRARWQPQAASGCRTRDRYVLGAWQCRSRRERRCGDGLLDDGLSRSFGVAHRLAGQLQVIFEASIRQVKSEIYRGRRGKRADGLGGIELMFDDQSKEMHEGELVLGVVDLAPEEGHLGDDFWASCRS